MLERNNLSIVKISEILVSRSLFFSLFLGYACSLGGNKLFVSENLALRTDFKAVRKAHKRLARRNLFLYLILVKICPNLVEKFLLDTLIL